MQIILDYRESKLNDLLRSEPNFNYLAQNLHLGDIQIIFNDTVYIIERKTLDDFSSSIIDGRYKEQKQRLLESGAQIIYIIEGHTKNQHGVPLSTLYSCMFLLQVRDRICVIRSYDINETVKILVSLAKKIGTGIIDVDVNQSHIKVKRRSENVDVYLQMLCCIPGISVNIAKNIIDKFPTMESLVRHINETNTLVSIDKIGSKLSNKIIHSLKGNYC
jgi:ERCC4-type nuclease